MLQIVVLKKSNDRGDYEPNISDNDIDMHQQYPGLEACHMCVHAFSPTYHSSLQECHIVVGNMLIVIRCPIVIIIFKHVEDTTVTSYDNLFIRPD